MVSALNGQMELGLCLPPGKTTSPRPLAAVFTWTLQGTGEVPAASDFCKEQFAMCHQVSQSKVLYEIFGAANVHIDSGSI